MTTDISIYTERFKKLINDISIEKVNELCLYYYDNSLPDNHLKNNYLKLKETINEEKHRELCLNLCIESINRDFIDFIRTGTRGDFGQRLYRLGKK